MNHVQLWGGTELELGDDNHKGGKAEEIFSPGRARSSWTTPDTSAVSVLYY